MKIPRDMPLAVRREARSLIADHHDRQGKHEEARLTRAGMRDNDATEVLAASIWVSAVNSYNAENRALVAGALAGLAIGFLAAYILLV